MDEYFLLEKIIENDLSKPTKDRELKKNFPDQAIDEIEDILRRLSKEGFVKKKEINKSGGIHWEITEKGIDKVRERYYRKKLEKGLEFTQILFGEPISGVGEGKKFVSMEGYQQQFKRELGFKPFPGTLNLRLRGNNIDKANKLKRRKGIEIKSFKENQRKYGEVNCFPSLVNGIESAIIFPQKTRYKDKVIELIAPIELKNKVSEKVIVEVKNEF